MKRNIISIFSVIILVIGGGSAKASTGKLVAYDIILAGGQVIDGSGNNGYTADVGIRNGVIEKIGDLTQSTSKQRIEVNGKIISPGFIDIHSHSDDAKGAELGLRAFDPKRRQAINLITQGITTVVVNPDGDSKVGLTIAQQRKALEEGGIAPNVALMVAHNAIRAEVMKDDYKRSATESEIKAMRERVRQGMEEGAFGLTSGLEYAPGIWSDIVELTELMEEVAYFEGLHISHIRSEAAAPMWWLPSQHEQNPPQLLDAVREVIAVAENTNTRGVVTHMKIRGITHWGQSKDVIALINDARSRGVDMYGDQYPYNTSGSDGQIIFIPAWAFGANPDGFKSPGDIDFKGELKKTLSHSQKKIALYRDIEYAIAFRGGVENVVILDYPDESLIGHNLGEVALAREMSVVELVIALQMEGFSNKAGGVQLRSFSLQEEDMFALMKKDWVATSSDGAIALPNDGLVHARYYGAFPRKIAHYVREKGVISLEHAIRSMTGLPAKILRLKTRGLLKPDMVADIVVFDYEKIMDQSTYTNPHQYSTGIDYVFINGHAVVTEQKPNGLLIGKTLTFGKD